MDSLVHTVASICASSQPLDRRFDDVLAHLGVFSGARFAQLYGMDLARRTVLLLRSWTRPDVAGTARELTGTLFPSWARRLSTPELLRMPAADDEDPALAEGFLELRGARQAVVVPLHQGAQLVGIIILDDPERLMSITDGDAPLLTVGGLLGMLLPGTEVTAPSEGGGPMGVDAAVVRAFAHDFRNLLSVILNGAEMLVEDLDGVAGVPVDDEMTRESLEDVVTAARQAEALVTRLQRMARQVDEDNPRS